MGALAYAGRKALGIVLLGLGVFFGMVFGLMAMFMPGYYPIALIIGFVVFIAGAIFGTYFLRSANRHL
jgi:hypothetical protein